MRSKEGAIVLRQLTRRVGVLEKPWQARLRRLGKIGSGVPMREQEYEPENWNSILRI